MALRQTVQSGSDRTRVALIEIVVDQAGPTLEYQTRVALIEIIVDQAGPTLEYRTRVALIEIIVDQTLTPHLRDRALEHPAAERPLSMPTSPERTPRPKKSNSPEWQSPDRAVLRSVLQQQVANVKLPSSEVQHAIEFFPISLKAFNEMLSSCPSPDFSVHAYHGHLYTDLQTEPPPPGSFKTAHPGRLSLDAPQTLVPPALGMIPYESIAVKRAYYKEMPSYTGVITAVSVRFHRPSYAGVITAVSVTLHWPPYAGIITAVSHSRLNIAPAILRWC
ncbi:hypothetical protein JB92DRAFT_2835516 [Gautieria morchelliformis]|nr:hypothetical protein JB92DRAFT_2835516 [Gautieria morchelliformis]